MLNLQIVVLKAPILTLAFSKATFTNNLFSQMLALKYHGYSGRHNKNILPIDATDFIGTHLIVCEKENGLLTPLMAYKSTTLKECERYNLPFPFLTLLEKAGNEICYKHTLSLIKKFSSKEEDLSYDTSWTMSPNLEGNKEKRKILKEILEMLLVKHHIDHKIPHWVTFGICKVKTDLIFKAMGGIELSNMPIINHPGLGGEKAIAILLKDHSYLFQALRMAQKYQSLWDARIEINNESDERFKKSA